MVLLVTTAGGVLGGLVGLVMAVPITVIAARAFDHLRQVTEVDVSGIDFRRTGRRPRRLTSDVRLATSDRRESRWRPRASPSGGCDEPRVADELVQLHVGRRRGTVVDADQHDGADPQRR